jgi:hypothetical protein
VGEVDGVHKVKKDGEASSQSYLTISKDLDSQEAMVTFSVAALASTEKDQAWLHWHSTKQKANCWHLAHLAALIPKCPRRSCELRAGVWAGDTGVQGAVGGSATLLCPNLQRNGHHFRVYCPLVLKAQHLDEK